MTRASKLSLNYLLLLYVFFFAHDASASEIRLQLSLPGEVLNQTERDKKTRLSDWVAKQHWYSVSLKENTLILEPATETTEANYISITGKSADRLLSGKPLKHSIKPKNVTLKHTEDTILFFKLNGENAGKDQSLNRGEFPSSISPDVLKEGWNVSAEINGQKWKFYTRQQKRSDGKMLAGSLEIMAESEISKGSEIILLPKASGMAFTKQELLWLGDLNRDGQPDLLLKRTWVTGEIDFVLVITPIFASAYFDPDHPESYFSSGVEPEANDFTWHKDRQEPTPFKFINQGRFSMTEEEWKGKLSDDAVLLPITLTDRQFKLNGESIRFTLEHLPRAQQQESELSSGQDSMWDGSVLVKVNFRGKSQTLMQAQPPNSGSFTLSVGLIGGKPSIKIDYQPHYNNSFSKYWIYDEQEMRFRRLRTEQSQKC